MVYTWNAKSQVCARADLIIQMCSYAYIIIQAHLVEVGADAAIDHICEGSTIVHSHVVQVLKSPFATVLSRKSVKYFSLTIGVNALHTLNEYIL